MMAFSDDLQYQDPDGVKLAEKGFKRMNDPRVFSDDDLKRLKDAIREQEDSNDPFARHGLLITFDGSKALIARLEAAERLNQAYEYVDTVRATPSSTAVKILEAKFKRYEAREAWRKSCGK